MHLSLHAEYALRVLVYVGTHRDRVVRTAEVSRAYGISKHHLVRVVQTLASSDYLEIHTGRSGGVTLAREPEVIRLGDVVRAAEPNMRLVECFDRKTNTCVIAPVCALKGMFREALEAFLDALNRHTLADIIRDSNHAKLAAVFAKFIGWDAPAPQRAPNQ
jgi:Rrf2 family nitric oxide-sensitive transcriptional repressor